MINLFKLYNYKNYKEILSTIFFVLFILFSTATKLRLPETSIGIFEIALLMFASISYWAKRITFKFHKNIVIYFIFLIILLLYSSDMSIESSYILKTGKVSSISLFYRDISAYFYCFLISLLVLDFHLKNSDLLLILVASIFFSFLFIFFNNIGNFDFFYFQRFSFLSKNPNQFALYILPFPFFIFYLKRNEKKINIIFFVLFLISSIFIGIKVRSYALLLTWMFLLPFYLFQKCSLDTRINKFFLYLILISFFGVLIFTLSCFYNSIISEFLVRLDIWKCVIESIWKNGVLLGEGPGKLIPFKTYPLGAKLGHVSHIEVHNTFLELIYISGIFPLLVFVVFCFINLKKAIEKRQYDLFLFLLSLILFSFSHSFLRFPIFYIYIVIFYKLLYGYKVESKK